MLERFLQLLEDFFNSSAFSSYGSVSFAYTGQPNNMWIFENLAEASGDEQLEVLLKGDSLI